MLCMQRHHMQVVLAEQALRRFALVISNAEGVPVERHVLDMQVR